MSQGPIVVGTDGSPRAELAVDKAGELAQALGAPVHVACASGAIVGGATEWPVRMTGQRVVQESGDRLRNRGLTVQEHLPKDRGDAATALIAVADYVGAQMIVVGNKGMTGMRRFLGSVPNRVSHEAQRSILIVPTDSPSLAEYSGSSIVVGTDGSTGSIHVVSEAARLAKALDGQLHIASAGNASALAEANERATTEGVTATTHDLQGDPADGLRDLAKEMGAAMIIVGSKGMHTGERERFGNVAEKISHGGTYSVLIVSAGGAGDGDGDALSGAVAGDAGGSGEEVTA